MSAEDLTLTEAMSLLQTELEAEPSSGAAGGVQTPGPDIPALREQLSVLVSTGRAKEAIGVQLTHDQVKRLSDKDVEKYDKRYKTCGLKDDRVTDGQLHFRCHESDGPLCEDQRH